MDAEAARQKVIRYLDEHAYSGHPPVLDDTEIYYDLRLYGDDIYELAIWVQQEFGVPAHTAVLRRAPFESRNLNPFRRWAERRDKKLRRFPHFKVRDVLDAIELGHW